MFELNKHQRYFQPKDQSVNKILQQAIIKFKLEPKGRCYAVCGFKNIQIISSEFSEPQ